VESVPHADGVIQAQSGGTARGKDPRLGAGSYRTWSHHLSREFKKDLGENINALRVLVAYLSFGGRGSSGIFPGDEKVCERGRFDYDLLEQGRTDLIEHAWMEVYQLAMKGAGTRRAYRFPKCQAVPKGAKLKTIAERARSETMSNDMIQLLFLDGGSWRALEVLSILMVFRNKDNEHCYPSFKEIGYISEIDHKHFQMGVNELVRIGWLDESALHGYWVWSTEHLDTSDWTCYVFKTFGIDDETGRQHLTRAAFNRLIHTPSSMNCSLTDSQGDKPKSASLDAPTAWDSDSPGTGEVKPPSAESEPPESVGQDEREDSDKRPLAGPKEKNLGEIKRSHPMIYEFLRDIEIEVSDNRIILRAENDLSTSLIRKWIDEKEGVRDLILACCGKESGTQIVVM